MKAPVNLSHRPVVSVDDYNQIDGYYAGEDSDAKAISLGFSTWGDGISAKVWRYVTTERGTLKWSRQSEELPLHRVLDLAILLIVCCKKIKEKPDVEWKAGMEVGNFPICQNGKDLPINISKWWTDVNGNPAPNKKNMDEFYEYLKNVLKSG